MKERASFLAFVLCVGNAAPQTKTWRGIVCDEKGALTVGVVECCDHLWHFCHGPWSAVAVLRTQLACKWGKRVAGNGPFRSGTCG